MKKQLATVFALLALVTGSAVAKEKNDGSKMIIKEIMIREPFHKLVVEGNVDVLLFENSTTIANVQGRQKNVDAVEFTEKNGVLTITASSVNGKKPVVYLPVRHLAAIEAWKDAVVTGTTVLQSPDLTLLLNDDCKISVTATGKIKFQEGAETSLMVLKNIIRPIDNNSL